MAAFDVSGLSSLLSLFRTALGALSRVPTAVLLFDPPSYSLLPSAWLKMSGARRPPLTARVGIENFGTNVLRGLRIRLNGLIPSYPIEASGIGASQWRVSADGSSIEIDELDPKEIAAFMLFFEEPPVAVRPVLLCSDKLVGDKSFWLRSLYTSAWPYVLLPGMTVAFGVAATAYFGHLIYENHWSERATSTQRLLEDYYKAGGLRKCELRTVSASDGSLTELALRSHAKGEADLLRLNNSSSMEMLLKRSWAIVLVCPS
jgi:hypothetical protein